MTAGPRRQAAGAPLALLAWFGVEDALAGDVLEAFTAGRSRLWLWRQVSAAMLVHVSGQLRARPLALLRGVALGWIVLAGTFVLLGDRVTEALAWAVSGWDRAEAYRSGWWRPYYAAAFVMSYATFAASGWTVGRAAASRRDRVNVIVYAVSVEAALVFAVAAATRGPVALPHPIFYFLWVALPFQVYSGLLLAPLSILVGAVAGARATPTAATS
jgi:hypothetical protein